MVCTLITEALWKGSKTVRGASWNSLWLQPGQHFDQQRAVSCYAAPSYSRRFSAGSDKRFHSTILKTELRGGDCGLERRCKNIRSGSSPGCLCCVVCLPPFPATLVSDAPWPGRWTASARAQRFPPDQKQASSGRPAPCRRRPRNFLGAGHSWCLTLTWRKPRGVLCKVHEARLEYSLVQKVFFLIIYMFFYIDGAAPVFLSPRGCYRLSPT